jgi:hypothetical protein
MGVGCVSSKVHKLPAYDLAMSLPGPESPKLFFAEAIDLTELPAMVPYAQVTARSGSSISRETRAKDIWHHAKKLKADVVIVEESGEVYTGSTSAYLGLGISQSTANYASGSLGQCYRLSGARIGIKKDKDNMVLGMSDDVRGVGLLEGDKILSVNGFDPDKLGKFILTAKPGDEAAIVWIRPGTGRMEGKVKLLPNPPTHLQMADSMELTPPAKKKYTGPRAE